MRTLFININGENIQSTIDIIVVGRPEDAIVNKFFFELGKEILKGVSAPGIASIKKKDIVTDFRIHDEKSYNLIMEQWKLLKQELLGENPTGLRTVNLPGEYISWLQNSSQPVYAEIAKSLYQRGGNVEVSLDKIYKNAICIIVNNIEPEDCKGCGQFVVNDDAVTDDSAITGSIQERMPQIAFVPFEDFGKCTKCGKKPCECKIDSKPSGENSVWVNKFFPFFDVVLGKTTKQELINSHKMEDGQIYYVPGDDDDDVLINFTKDGVVCSVIVGNGSIPQYWLSALDFSKIRYKDIAKIERYEENLEDLHFNVLRVEEDVLCAISPDNNLWFEFNFCSEGIKEISVGIPYCIECHSLDVDLVFSTDGKFKGINCNECGYEHLMDSLEDIDSSVQSDDDDETVCPKCGSDDIDYDRHSPDCTCNDCGYVFDEYPQCPECGSEDVCDDGSGHVQYSCNVCGHVWGDDWRDNEGNIMANYLDIYDVMLGSTTRNDILLLGGKRNFGRDDEAYKMESGIEVDISKTGKYVNSIHWDFSSKHRNFPPTYEKLGITWNITKEELIEKLKKLGFYVSLEHPMDIYSTIKVSQYNKLTIFWDYYGTGHLQSVSFFLHNY